MNKRILTFCIGILTLSQGYSQNNWVNTTPMKFGIGQESWTVNDIYNNFRYEQVEQNSLGQLDVAKNNSFGYSRYPLVFENIGKNIHFSGSTTGTWDFLARVLRGFPMVGDDDTEALPLELMPLQFGAGGWIKDKIGVFGGLNVAYSRINFKDDDIPDEIVFGGNKRGLHTVFFYSTPKLLLKSTLMHNWVANSKKAAKGTAQSIDIESYYSFQEDANFGLWAGIRFEQMKMTGPQGQGSEDWSNSGINVNKTYSFPEISGNSVFIRGGLFFLIGGRS